MDNTLIWAVVIILLVLVVVVLIYSAVLHGRILENEYTLKVHKREIKRQNEEIKRQNEKIVPGHEHAISYRSRPNVNLDYWNEA